MSSKMWEYFTCLRDENGKLVGTATCNECADNSKEYKIDKGGTSNAWKHFMMEHHTHSVKDGNGKKKRHCNICKTELKGKMVGDNRMHVLECIERQRRAAVGDLEQPPAQTDDLPGAGSSSSMDLEPPPTHTRDLPGADSSSMDLEPADLGVPSLPSASSRSGPGGSSSDGKEPDDMENVKHDLAAMIALSGYDASIINDVYFKSFVERLDPKFKLPSFKDIVGVCHEIVRREMDDSLDLFGDFENGRTSLAVGKATVIESEVIYVAYHFIDSGWNLHKVIDDAAINPVYVETRANIGLKMIDLTAGYCSINDATVFTVAWGITDDHSKLKYLLNGQDFPTLYYEDTRTDALCITFMDYILHSVAQHLYLNIDVNISGDISGLLSYKNDELETLSCVGPDPWAYKEAWYSWYCFMSIDRSKRSAGTGLGFSELLYKIFDEIYRAIRKISASSGPTANLCLAELFNVRKVLQSEIALASGGDQTNLYEDGTGFVDNKDVATVLRELTEILDKAIQESYLLWSIPLILDPRSKLGFVITIFTEAFGKETADRYISEISTNMKELYNSKYIADAEFEDEWEREEAQQELNRYMTTSVIQATSFDILEWWKYKGSNYYPTLADMAKDSLAMPTCNQLSSKQTAQLKSICRGYWDGG